eukprot:TRINITY_DN11358_c0_g1_i1.p1 TRINITY_DN11358_c0_g1~~TRINITY_DN11358_c0_g1_i1.p1  ORF type:complete len:966 (+),score=179.77 TRINITY_DN11358_c0_g1_i1:61-2898(+)
MAVSIRTIGTVVLACLLSLTTAIITAVLSTTMKSNADDMKKGSSLMADEFAHLFLLERTSNVKEQVTEHIMSPVQHLLVLGKVNFELYHYDRDSQADALQVCRSMLALADQLDHPRFVRRLALMNYEHGDAHFIIEMFIGDHPGEEWNVTIYNEHDGKTLLYRDRIPLPLSEDLLGEAQTDLSRIGYHLDDHGEEYVQSWSRPQATYGGTLQFAHAIPMIEGLPPLDTPWLITEFSIDFIRDLLKKLAFAKGELNSLLAYNHPDYVPKTNENIICLVEQDTGILVECSHGFGSIPAGDGTWTRVKAVESDHPVIGPIFQKIGPLETAHMDEVLRFTLTGTPMFPIPPSDYFVRITSMSHGHDEEEGHGEEGGHGDEEEEHHEEGEGEEEDHHDEAEGGEGDHGGAGGGNSTNSTEEHHEEEEDHHEGGNKTTNSTEVEEDHHDEGTNVTKSSNSTAEEHHGEEPDHDAKGTNSTEEHHDEDEEDEEGHEEEEDHHGEEGEEGDHGEEGGHGEDVTEQGPPWVAVAMIPRAELLATFDEQSKNVDDNEKRGTMIAVVVASVIIIVSVVSIFAYETAVITPLVSLMSDMHLVEIMNLDELGDYETRTSMFAEIKGIRESFVAMVHMLIEYKAFMPSYLLHDDTEGEEEEGGSVSEKTKSKASIKSKASLRSSRCSTAIGAGGNAGPSKQIFALELNHQYCSIVTISVSFSGGPSEISNSYNSLMSFIVGRTSQYHPHVVISADYVQVAFNVPVRVMAFSDKSVLFAENVRKEGFGFVLGMSCEVADVHAGNVGVTTQKWYLVRGNEMIERKILAQYSEGKSFLACNEKMTTARYSGGTYMFSICEIIYLNDQAHCAYRIAERKAEDNEEWMYALSSSEGSSYGVYNKGVAAMLAGDTSGAQGLFDQCGGIDESKTILPQLRESLRTQTPYPGIPFTSRLVSSKLLTY